MEANTQTKMAAVNKDPKQNLMSSREVDVETKYTRLLSAGCYRGSHQHWNDQVYNRKTKRRCRPFHRPYDPSDSFAALCISRTRPLHIKPDTNVPVRVARCTEASQHPKALIQPAKLKLAQSNTNASTKSSGEDFASLAAKSSADTNTDYLLDSAAWNEIRNSLPETGRREPLHDSLGELSGASCPSQATPLVRTCSQEAQLNELCMDFTAEELASYFEELVHIPKNMSEMAQMMYT